MRICGSASCATALAALVERDPRLDLDADRVVDRDAGPREPVHQRACVTMPAPRPSSEPVAFSSTWTSCPSRSSMLAASRPPSDPPTMRMRAMTEPLQAAGRSAATSVAGIVQFDHAAVRVVEEHLVQPDARHRALAEGDAHDAQVIEHRGEAVGEERDVIDRAGAAQLRLVALAQVAVEALLGGAVGADDVDHRVGDVAVVAAIHPQAGKRERRARADGQAEHVGVETPARLEVGRCGSRSG